MSAPLPVAHDDGELSDAALDRVVALLLRAESTPAEAARREREERTAHGEKAPS